MSTPISKYWTRRSTTSTARHCPVSSGSYTTKYESDPNANTDIRTEPPAQLLTFRHDYVRKKRRSGTYHGRSGATVVNSYGPLRICTLDVCVHTDATSFAPSPGVTPVYLKKRQPRTSRNALGVLPSSYAPYTYIV